MKRLITACFFIWGIITNLNAQVQQDENTLKNKIDHYLIKGVQQGFSGAVLVAKNNQIILHKGYGMADKENMIPYDITTVSTIGSVTKQFTATAILKLEELNKLSTENTIDTFFPNLPDDKKSITLHQLLTHSSGLVSGLDGGDFEDIPTKKFFKKLFATKLLHKPGTKYHYANTGYSVLARVIELVSGMNYENFLYTYLFKPAGMNNTGYLIPNWKNHTIASGYIYNIINVGTLISRFQKSGKVFWNLKGNGGIHSTTADMFKWYEALKTNKIITRNSLKKLTTPYIQEYDDGQSQYAYGWAIYKSKNNSKIISHNGGNNIFFHDYIWLPQEDIVILLFTNCSSREVEVAWPIQKMMLDANYTPKPIKRSIYQLTYDYITERKSKNPVDLIDEIRKKYSSQIKNPNQLNRLGYRVLKNQLIETNENGKWAIAIFKLNTELFPDNGNLWDSLGESYANNNQIENAIKSYKKALELGQDSNCDWCESSTKALNALLEAQASNK
ncbi:serine hydrolase [Aquimarina litoralis]|uniref:serine hydrolase n=1 Tax=Aquimarina litoralis TaxID=584605 RepID=UPI001C57E0AB|nr:serine hydrolase [Aquimarina litoralis]MBW1297395.1 serine hydrolase [Aquimarina litoralis]